MYIKCITAKYTIMQTTPYGSPGILVFEAKRLGDIPIGLPQTEAPNTRGIKHFATFDK